VIWYSNRNSGAAALDLHPVADLGQPLGARVGLGEVDTWKLSPGRAALQAPQHFLDAVVLDDLIDLPGA
jgi:hypothetical protein